MCHHIDMDKSYNDPSNLHLATDSKQHSIAHRSYINLCKVFLKEKVIYFKKERSYFLNLLINIAEEIINIGIIK